LHYSTFLKFITSLFLEYSRTGQTEWFGTYYPSKQSRGRQK